MKYPLEKYRFIERTRKDGVKEIIAISTYAGKAVKGVAKCAPGDNYFIADGEIIAAARCNAKVAAKRAKRAEKKMAEAEARLAEAIKYRNAMQEYVVDSAYALKVAEDELAEILSDYKGEN